MIPREKETLMRLPGIGPYTASAIMSLAYNQDAHVVDGNVERVVARLLDLDAPIKSRRGRRAVERALDEWAVLGNARAFNQALMEIGAAICTPAQPKCGLCPVAKDCHSLCRGTVSERPVKSRSVPVEKVTAVVGILRDNGKIFIQKRPPEGLLAGLWEFPGGKGGPGESPEDALTRELTEELGVRVRVLDKVTRIRHAYTRFRVLLHAFRCSMDPPGQAINLNAAVEGRWVSEDELDQFAFPSANRRLIEILEHHKEES